MDRLDTITSASLTISIKIQNKDIIMRKRKHPKPEKREVKTYEKFCPQCAAEFETDRKNTRFCDDECRWRYNGLKNKDVDGYYKILSDHNIPFEYGWRKWAEKTVGDCLGDYGYSSKDSIYTDIDLASIDHALEDLNYPGLIDQSENHKRTAVEILLSPKEKVLARKRAREKLGRK